MTELEIYGLIGEDGFRRLVRAFYAQVPADDVLGRMYPRDAVDPRAQGSCPCPGDEAVDDVISGYGRSADSDDLR